MNLSGKKKKKQWKCEVGNSLVLSLTVVCFTKATSPPPCTRHLKAPVYP